MPTLKGRHAIEGNIRAWPLNPTEAILAFDAGMAQLWGHLRVPHPENPLDKQIAATALIYDLVVVTRNTGHFEATGVRLLSPFR